jgi:hypothetical protein
MITEFKLSNFKAFGKEQTVPLKPITLVFGPNSAGKSSILHSLLFAHEAIRSGNLDIRQTQIGGDSVDLGGFEQLTHRRDRERAVVLTFRMDSLLNKESRTSDFSPLDDVEVRATLQFSRAEDDEFDKNVTLVVDKINVLSEENDIDSKDLTYAAYEMMAKEAGHDVSAWDFRFEDSMDEMIKPVLRRFEILINGKSLMQASSRAQGELRIDRLSLSHPAFRAIVDAIVTSNTTSDSLSESDVKVVEGVANEMILTGTSGSIITNGKVSDISGFNFGDYLYVSKTGGLTSTLPSEGVAGFIEGDWVIRVGVVGKNQDDPLLKDLFVNVQIIGQI